MTSKKNSSEFFSPHLEAETLGWPLQTARADPLRNSNLEPAELRCALNPPPTYSADQALSFALFDAQADVLVESAASFGASLDVGRPPDSQSRVADRLKRSHSMPPGFTKDHLVHRPSP